MAGRDDILRRRATKNPFAVVNLREDVQEAFRGEGAVSDGSRSPSGKIQRRRRGSLSARPNRFVFLAI